MEDQEGDVIEIIPMDEYDRNKAKARASLSWILCKAYQDQVPTEFQEPFYDTTEGGWQIKPRLANLLASSELYCQACRTMFGENASQWKGHLSIIQVLSRKGIYAVGSDSTDVTETILMQSAPFKLKAHLALIDALMKAFSREIMSIDRVTQTVRRFATFSASSELPTDTEDAILFWVNKVCVTVQKHLESAQDTVIEGGETSQRVRIISNKSPRDSISVPIIESLVEDMGDGCSVATLISFYCPQILKLEDVCLKSNVGIADSLYNLRLIRSFCERHLPFKTWHFSYEDLLYTHKSIKVNVMMMISELFYWFEIKTLPIVTGGGFTPAAEQSQPQSSVAGRVPSVPISNVTKQSFQRLKADSELRSSSTPDIHKMSPTTPVSRHAPLLHKRQQQSHGHFQDDHCIRDSRAGVHRTGSLTTQDLKTFPGVPRQSVVAWPEKSSSNAKPDSSQSHGSSNLLANVSIDSDLNASFSSGSIDLGDLDTSRLNTERTQFEATESQDENVINFSLQSKHKTDYKQKTPFPEHIDIESVNSTAESGVPCAEEHESAFHSPRGGHSDESVHFTPKVGQLEPLMPARLKPAKEKINNHTKEEERDELPRRKTPSPPKVKKVVQIDPQLAVIERSGMCDESTETITPVPDNDMFDTLRNSVIDDQCQTNSVTPKKFEAFFVRGSISDGEDILTHRSDATVAESYTIDNVQTPEAARAAGIPVIEDFNSTPRRLSREGSVASSKSSGEYSDHESHKIHNDHKTQETENKVNNNNDNYRKNENDFSDPGRFIMQKPVLVTRPHKDNVKSGHVHETNFAQIKQMKQFGNIDNSGFVYMQDDNQRPSLKDAFQKKQQEKKISFGPTSNQRTWPQNVGPNVNPQNEAAGTTAATSDSSSTELLKIKMKLEEKRKAIERKKHTQEIQQQKIRQRLGKAAFLHVVSKPKDDMSMGESVNGSLPARMVTSDPELPLETITESSMTSSTTSSVSPSCSPLRSPAVTHPKNPRPVSRDELQQTIENVRKKWFNEEDLVAPKLSDRLDNQPPEMFVPQNGEYRDTYSSESRVEEQTNRRPVFDRRSASAERVMASGPKQMYDTQNTEKPVVQTLSQQNMVNDTEVSYDRKNSEEQPGGQNIVPQNVGQTVVDRRSASVEREGRPSSRRDSGTRPERSESYDEYNTSLDKLNQSLSDLQGEIMKLSLKQRKPEQSRLTAGETERPVDQRSRSKSPPRALDVRQKAMPERSKISAVSEERSRSAHPTHSQMRSSSEPRQVAPEYEKDQQIGDYQSQTLPRQQTSYHHNQGQSFMMQNQVTLAGPAGPVYGTPNHFIPGPSQAGIPPTAQQYGSYIMGPTTQQPLGHIHQPVPAPYQQSPPQVYPGAPGMYPGQQFSAQQLVSPQSQPYSAMYASPTHSHFQNFPQTLTGTYTTSAHQHVQYTSPGSQAMLFDPGNQQNFLQQQQPTQTGSQIQQLPQTGSQIQQQTQQTVPTDIPNRQIDNVISDSSVSKTRSEVTSEPSANESVRTESVHKVPESQPDVSQYESSVIADFARTVEEKGSQREGSGSESGKSCDAPEASSVTQQDTSAVGFVIGQDESTLDQSKEEEMQKRKDKIEKMRQKRQEEQERKKQKLEQEMMRKREAERLKQEEAERRKSDEKARREQIFRQYLEKKEEEEEGPKKEKRAQKSRPKSMFVKAGPGPDVSEGYSAAACSSNEDLSARAFTVPAGGNNAGVSKGPRKVTPKSYKQSMRKAVSCHTLHHNGSGDSQNLAFGGLTHRRPPSPDLYRTRRGQRSNESSEAGSAHGGEYTGPKLFVKPSAKSNRHIITNAISHCCLAGSVNTEQKNKVLEEIAKSSAKHFIILFRDASCGYRGLYGFDPDTEDCFKIVGTGPRTINNEMVEKYFKYNSGGKSFSEVASTKHISVSIDAVCLQNSVWKVNKPPPKGMR